MVGVSMAIIDDYGDEDLSDNRFNAFRDVKFVIFSENFDGRWRHLETARPAVAGRGR